MSEQIRVELPGVRYTGRPIMTMIAEALGEVCPRCKKDHKEPHCDDGRQWGPYEPNEQGQ